MLTLAQDGVQSDLIGNELFPTHFPPDLSCALGNIRQVIPELKSLLEDDLLPEGNQFTNRQDAQQFYQRIRKIASLASSLASDAEMAGMFVKSEIPCLPDKQFVKIVSIREITSDAAKQLPMPMPLAASVTPTVEVPTNSKATQVAPSVVAQKVAIDPTPTVEHQAVKGNPNISIVTCKENWMRKQI